MQNAHQELMWSGPLEEINWDSIWDRQWKLTSFKGDGLQFWDERAELFEHSPRADDYVEQLLPRLELTPEASVLDVGCGIGALSIPLARHVRQVTALDWSPRMLDVVSRGVAQMRLDNVKTVRLDWPRVEVGRDVETHDVVLASRSLPMGDLRGALVRLHQAAKRTCYLTWIIDGNELDAAVCSLLGRDYHPFPAYTIIYEMLYGMGICAEVEIFRVSERRMYNSPEEVVAHLVQTHHLDAQHDASALRALALRHLTSEDGVLYRDLSARWALMRWDKEQAG
jgi:SAM-dependent methyltransferase